MIKLVNTVVLFFCCTCLYSQVDIARIGVEIKKLTGEYFGDFKNLKGGLRSESGSETIYDSRLKLTGSSDSSNSIHFVKDREIWSFTADFDKKDVTIQRLDSLLNTINFSFGKLTLTPYGSTWGKSYTPAEKKGASEKLRCFFIFIFDQEKKFGDNSGKLTFTIGQNDYYRNK